MSRGGVRWAIFVHDADGDSGYGRIVGAFKTAEKADAKADAIRQAAEKDTYGSGDVECIVLPMEPGGVGSLTVAQAVSE